MKEQQYTPEPWWNYLEVIHGPSAYGDIAECKRMTHLGEAEANAERIVACVNACEGIPTDVLTRIAKSNTTCGLEALLEAFRETLLATLLAEEEAKEKDLA